MTNKKYYTVGKILKSIIKIVERVIVDTFTQRRWLKPKTGVTSGEGTAYPSGAPEFTPGF
jgi:hypothetical protein